MSSPPLLTLSLLSGPHAGHVFLLVDGLQTVGRGDPNQIVIDDPSVSRQHARIIVQANAAFIQDLGSSNGTFVNGQRISGLTSFEPGDTIQIGTVVTLSVGQLGSPGHGLGPDVTFVPGRSASESTPSALRLTIQHGPQPGQSLPLVSGVQTIGRGPGNHLVISDPTISKQHAQIAVQPEGTWIQDLGSSNGTFVNGLRISGATWLRAGDIVRLGTWVTLVMESIPVMYPAPPRARPPLVAPGTSHTPQRRWALWGAGTAVLFLCLLGLAAGAWLFLLQPTQPVSKAAIVIQSPVAGAITLVDHPLLISALIHDPTGVARVELWADGELAGVKLDNLPDNAPIYRFATNWTPNSVGLHDLFIRAYGKDKRIVQSNIVTIRVQPGVYQALPGDTLESIAEETGTAVEALREANPKLWSPQPGLEIRLTGCPGDVVYTVRDGETLADIAATFGITDADLRRTNPGVEAQPPAGSQVQLQNISLDVLYQVQPGDSWLKVAALLNTELCQPQPEDEAFQTWVLEDGYRVPMPGEILNLPQTGPVVSGESLPADPGDLPGKPTNVNAESTPDCTSVRLRWGPPAAAVQQYRIYGRAPGGETLNQLAELDQSATEAIVETAVKGPWQFYVGAVDHQGLENLTQLEFDTSSCKSQVGGEASGMLTVKFHEFSAPTQQLYCYMRLGGEQGLYQRVPANSGDYISLPQPNVTGSKPALPPIDLESSLPEGYSFDLTWDQSRDLTVDFMCYGWVDGELLELGKGQAHHPPAEWDGRRHTRDADRLRVVYSIQPKDWEQLDGQRVLDPNFPPPYNVRPGAPMPVSFLDQIARGQGTGVAWDWQPGPGQSLGSVAGFQVIMREYEAGLDDRAGNYRETVVAEVLDETARSLAVWPSNESRTCSLWAGIYVRAFGHGPSISDYSQPLILEPVACPGMQRGGQIAYGDTVSGSIDPQFFFEDWTFAGAAGDQVILVASPTGGDLQPVLQIATGNSILASGQPVEWGEGRPFRLLVSGQYTIRVTRVGQASGSSQGSYSLHLDKQIPQKQIALSFNQIHVVRREDAILDDDLYVRWHYQDSQGTYRSGQTEILQGVRDGETRAFDPQPFVTSSPGDSFSLLLSVTESETADAQLFNKAVDFAKIATKLYLNFQAAGACSWGSVAGLSPELLSTYDTLMKTPGGPTLMRFAPSPCDLAVEGAGMLANWLISQDEDDQLGAVQYGCQLTSQGSYYCTPTPSQSGSQGGNPFTLASSVLVNMSYSGDTWGFTDVTIPACHNPYSWSGPSRPVGHGYLAAPLRWGGWLEDVWDKSVEIGGGIVDMGGQIVDGIGEVVEMVTYEVLCPAAEGLATGAKIQFDAATGNIRHSYSGQLTTTFTAEER